MAPPTFAELLTQHLQRTGISDSELARALSVRRQTIFRWKEGIVTRPRVRDDILRIAQKLRLTAAECDQLLLAAGFPPETLPVSAPFANSTTTLTAVVPVSAPAAEPGPDTVAPAPLLDPARQVYRRRPALMWLGLGGALVLVLIGFVARFGFPPVVRPAPTPTAVAPTPTVVRLDYPQAADGQTLLLVAQFTGYSAEQFNVAGRIGDELQQAIADTSLISTTVALWPEMIANASAADAALATSNAALIIWGEYDSGRVRANLTLSDKFATHHVDFALTSPDDLITTINEKVPAEVRMFALLAIGNLYPLDEFYASAARTFKQALALNPPQQKTRALLNFYIALAVSKAGTAEALAQAIGYYSQALELNPRLYDAVYNRGTLWLNRAYLLEQGSTEIADSLNDAIADLTATLGARNDYANAYLNRGIAFYERNQRNDQALAIDDFDHFIELRRTNYRGYYHRALAHIRGAEPQLWQADLATTLRYAPNYAPAYNALCWGYALAQQPQTALPYCDQAVALDTTGSSRDGRGIALAQLGRFAEAISELEAYVAWIRSLRPNTLFRRQRGPDMLRWIDALRAGENPFDAATLATLR